MIDRPAPEAVLSFSALSLYRSVVGTPLEGIAKREILSVVPTTVIEILKSTPFLDLWKGFQPNTLKFLTRTPVQVLSIKAFSSITPKKLDPMIRGGIIGASCTLTEAGVKNLWGVFITRFIQGQNWGVVRQEGIGLLAKGLPPALMHHSLSNAVFWAAYEKIRSKMPNSPATAGVIAGTIQVITTSPFYITNTLRQGINPPTENLLLLILKIAKEQGILQGLFLRGLLPRLIQSWATSAALMKLLERYSVISR